MTTIIYWRRKVQDKMSFCCWCLCIYSLWLKVSVSASDSWNIEVPHSVIGLEGSCVVIPCLFSYPGPDRSASSTTGIWLTDSNDKLYHSDTSKISTSFQHRTSLLGNLRHRNCSLKINPLRHGDGGPFTFRIEIADADKYSFKNNKVSVTVKDSAEQPILSVEEEMKSGKKATATCSVLHSCPSDPPHLTWSHQGKVSSQSSQQTRGQWKITSTLSFIPSRLDHKKILSCTVVFPGGKKLTSVTTLSVTYPPVDVRVVSRSSVMEGSSVELNCSSDSNPVAQSYHWFSAEGAEGGGRQLAEGPVYTLKSVDRHTKPLYCTAANTEGTGHSEPLQLNVVYPPEIKVGSSCTSEFSTVVCLCMVDSQPISDILWWSSDSSTELQSSSTERHGSLTIGTLQGVLHSHTMHCYANNSLGNSTVTLQVPHSGKLMYVAAAVTAFLVLIIGLMVWMVKRSCSRTEEPVIQTRTEMNVTNQPDSSKKRKDFSSYDGSQHVYGNMGLEEENDPYDYYVNDDDATYANV